LSATLSAVRFASGISFDQDTRNLCNIYATNLRDRTLALRKRILTARPAYVLAVTLLGLVGAAGVAFAAQQPGDR